MRTAVYHFTSNWFLFFLRVFVFRCVLPICYLRPSFLSPYYYSGRNLIRGDISSLSFPLSPPLRFLYFVFFFPHPIYSPIFSLSLLCSRNLDQGWHTRSRFSTVFVPGLHSARKLHQSLLPSLRLGVGWRLCTRASALSAVDSFFVFANTFTNLTRVGFELT